MMTIQALRRSRGITLTDLALLSGIPARTIASIEYGVQTLDHRTRTQLAHIFGVPPESLLPGAPPALQQELRRRMLAEARMVAPMVGLALATATLLAPVLRPAEDPAAPRPLAAAVAPPVVAAPPAAPSAAVVRGLANTLPVAALLADPPADEPAAHAGAGQAKAAGGPKAGLRAVVASADGTPAGCPVAAGGRVVVTQGYNVGTHAPAPVWGALDLAVDGDGDGRAEIPATQGVLVFATHAGAVRLALGSWPAGNYVRVTNDQTGWATAYAHLDQVFVSDGQWLEAGTPVGTVGNTGMSNGAHLHYEVWRNGVNVDPTPYVWCG